MLEMCNKHEVGVLHRLQTGSKREAEIRQLWISQGAQTKSNITKLLQKQHMINTAPVAAQNKSKAVTARRRFLFLYQNTGNEPPISLKYVFKKKKKKKIQLCL